MGTEKLEIITGVDKLVELVNSRGKIELAEAAKVLGVSVGVVQEWVNFLDHEGPIEVEYSLTKRYLTWRNSTRNELKDRSNEFSNKREVILRKAEVNLHSFKEHIQELKSLKPEFDGLKDELGMELNSVKKDLEALENYNRLRGEFKKQMDGQKLGHEIDIKTIKNHIILENKSYNDFLIQIRNESKTINEKKAKFSHTAREIQILSNKLEEFKSIADITQKRILEQDNAIKESGLQLEKLGNQIKELKKGFEHRKLDEINSLEKIKEQKIKMLKLQAQISMTIDKNDKQVKNSKEIVEKYRKFFEKKLYALDLYHQVSKDCIEIENSLHYLIRKAKLFKLRIKNRNSNGEIVELENKLVELNKRKEAFGLKVKKLFSFFNE